jgi:hypothetical protein
VYHVGPVFNGFQHVKSTPLLISVDGATPRASSEVFALTQLVNPFNGLTSFRWTGLTQLFNPVDRINPIGFNLLDRINPTG